MNNWENGMKDENVIKDKSMAFAIRIVRLYKYLSKEQHEYVMSKQVLRSGTSIGANVCEAVYGQSKPDFTAKMSIALKEAAETEYWLELLHKTDYLPAAAFRSIRLDCQEICKLLTTIVRNSK